MGTAGAHRPSLSLGDTCWVPSGSASKSPLQPLPSADQCEEEGLRGAWGGCPGGQGGCPQGHGGTPSQEQVLCGLEQLPDPHGHWWCLGLARSPPLPMAYGFNISPCLEPGSAGTEAGAEGPSGLSAGPTGCYPSALGCSGSHFPPPYLPKFSD